MENKDDNKLIINDFQNLINEAKTLDDVKNLRDKFVLSNACKNVVRVNKVNELLDIVTEEAKKRIVEKGGEMSDGVLLGYMRNLTQQVTLANNQVKDLAELEKSPQPMLNQTNIVNINTKDDEIKLSKDSRQKVLDIVAAILKTEEKPEEVEVEVEVIEDEKGE